MNFKAAVIADCCNGYALNPFRFGFACFIAHIIYSIAGRQVVAKVNAFVNRTPVVDVVVSAENGLTAFFKDGVEHSAVVG